MAKTFPGVRFSMCGAWSLRIGSPRQIIIWHEAKLFARVSHKTPESQNKFKAGISTCTMARTATHAIVSGCSVFLIFLSISSLGLVEIFSCCHLGSRFTSYRPLDYQKPKAAFNVLRFTEAIVYSEQVFERMTRYSQDQLTDVKARPVVERLRS